MPLYHVTLLSTRELEADSWKEAETLAVAQEVARGGTDVIGTEIVEDSLFQLEKLCREYNANNKGKFSHITCLNNGTYLLEVHGGGGCLLQEITQSVEQATRLFNAYTSK